MHYLHIPSDARIVDEIFGLTGTTKYCDEGWLMAMVATYGKTPEELKGFTWNDDLSINVANKKRPIQPVHPQWAVIFQLKEKQPSKKKGWSSLCRSLKSVQEDERIKVSVDKVLLAHKVRKIHYTPLKQQKQKRLALV